MARAAAMETRKTARMMAVSHTELCWTAGGGLSGSGASRGSGAPWGSGFSIELAGSGISREPDVSVCSREPLSGSMAALSAAECWIHREEWTEWAG